MALGGESIRIEISKSKPHLEIAEIVLYNARKRISPDMLSLKLSSTDSEFYFPEIYCNNNDILDFCSTSRNDSYPKLEITIDKSVKSFDEIVVYNRPIAFDLRNRINGAAISIFNDNNVLLWQGIFGNASSFKYRFAVDLASCTSNIDIMKLCYQNYAVPVDYERYSQIGQDEFAIEFFNEMKNGFFVDFGANDGVTYSNSYALEKNYGWRGIAVEPLPKHHKNLMVTRNCTILNVCASNSSGFKEFRIVNSNEKYAKQHGFDTDMLSGMVDTWIWQEKVDANEFTHRVLELDIYCVKTQEIFDHFHVTHIDYMSVDAEGAELSILQGIDWSRMDITLIHVDFTHEKIALFLESKGYRILIHGHDICAIRLNLFD